MHEPTLPDSPVKPAAPLPPIASTPQAAPMAALPPGSAPTFGEYRLLQPLAANQDGELWLGEHVATHAPHGVALLTKDALSDPGAIWRMRQELGRHLRESSPKMLIINPPLSSDEAASMKGLRTVRAGAPVSAVKRQLTPEERKQERKLIIIIILALILCMILATVAYVAFFGFMLWPEIQKTQMAPKITQARSEAALLSRAVDQWAMDHSMPEGSTYGWSQISDYVSGDFVDNAGPTGPVDPLGNPYVFTTTGEEVEVSAVSEEEADEVMSKTSIYFPSTPTTTVSP